MEYRAASDSNQENCEEMIDMKGVCPIPCAYSEWVTALEILKAKSDDAAILEVLRQGKMNWQSGVAERFFRRLSDVVNYRINNAVDRFQKEMNRAAGQEGPIVFALLSLRKELQFLIQVTNIPAVPSETKEQYCTLMREQANNMQKSLEDSAKRDRSGKLGSIVRNHKINIF